MIFSNGTFSKITVTDLYKEYMNGLNDETLPNFDFIAFSSLYKPEFKAAGQQKEYIDSYLKSAVVLAAENTRMQTPHNGINKLFLSYSLTLPTLYLCRHCAELSIKYAISQFGKSAKDIHGLVNLWNSFVSNLPTEKSQQDKTTLKNMLGFIKALDALDESGTELRYAVNKDKNCNQDQPLWANTQLIVSTTEAFVNQMYNISSELFDTVDTQS